MTKKTPFPKLGALLRKNFVAGVFVSAPVAICVWILVAVFRALWGMIDLVPTELQPSHFISDPSLKVLFDLILTLFATTLLALAVSFVGWASKRFLGRKILEVLAAIIKQIPVVRGVYSALTQLLETMAAGGGQQFSRVVYVEYPRRECWALAFVTGPARGPSAPVGHLNVYVPTTPNPTSGFHLIVPEKDVRESHMSVEDAFKTILSLGMAQPDVKH